MHVYSYIVTRCIYLLLKSATIATLSLDTEDVEISCNLLATHLVSSIQFNLSSIALPSYAEM